MTIILFCLRHHQAHLAYAHAHLNPYFAPKTSRKSKSGTSFLEHMLAVLVVANLSKGKN
jgi:hypothetical protein